MVVVLVLVSAEKSHQWLHNFCEGYFLHQEEKFNLHNGRCRPGHFQLKFIKSAINKYCKFNKRNSMMLHTKRNQIMYYTFITIIIFKKIQCTSFKKD